MTLIAMIRTADGTVKDIEVAGGTLDAAREIVSEGETLLSLRRD